VENSLASRRRHLENYAIECDVQLSRDGEAVVFHDDDLSRLTDAQGRSTQEPHRSSRAFDCAAATKHCRCSHSCLTLSPTHAAVVELKSRFDGDLSWRAASPARVWLRRSTCAGEL